MKNALKYLPMLAIFIACSSGNVDNHEEPEPTPPETGPDRPAELPGVAHRWTYRQLGSFSAEVAEKSGTCKIGERLYTIQDSDNPSDVTVSSLGGKIEGKIKLKGVKNVDFEAIACDQETKTIWVGDIGDNDEERSNIALYKISGQEKPGEVTPQKIALKYFDGKARNAEGLAYGNGGLWLSTKDFEQGQKLYQVNEKTGQIGSGEVALRGVPPVGELAIHPRGDSFLLVIDESETFQWCKFGGICEEIKTPYPGDHESAAWINDQCFVFFAEDESEIYQACWEAVEAPPEVPGEPVPTGRYIPAPGTSFVILDSDDGKWDAQVKGRKEQLVVVEAVPDDEQTCAEGYAEIAKEIDKLHKLGKRVSCYHSLSVESGRCDIGNFPSSAVGKKMKGWPEYWTDWRPTSKAHIFWDNRYEQFKKIGCDCVEDDNEVDPGDNETGFPLSTTDAQLASKKRASQAQALGMCHLAKNNPSISEQKSQNSDGVMVEEAKKYDEREDFSPWIKKKKFLGSVEYASGGCSAWTGAVVQYHPNGDYFTKDYKECK